MSLITTHPGATPQQRIPAGTARRLLRRLSALAYAAAERLTSAHREVPPEFYRFPPF